MSDYKLAYIAWCVLISIGIRGEVAFAQEFHIKGVVEHRHYSKQFTNEFEVFVKGKAWRVTMSRKLPDSVFPGPITRPDGRVIPPPSVPGRKPGDKIAEDRSESFILGAESLEEHFNYQSSSEFYLGSPGMEVPGRSAQPPVPPGRRMTQIATLYSGSVPWECREPTLPYLWLAYGSRPYFENLTTNRVVPFYHQWAQRSAPRGYQQEARWRLAVTVPHLPVEVSYLNPGQKLERVLTNGVLTTNLTWIPYWSPFHNGFVNARYVVLATTNVGDLVLPTELRFEVNEPSGGGQMTVFRSVHGKAHSVSSYCPKKDLKFEFPGETHVIDERIRINPDMSRLTSYQTTRMLTTNEAMALIKGRSQLSPQKLAMAKPKPRPWWQGPVAVGALLVPGGVVWWRLRRAKAAKPGGVA